MIDNIVFSKEQNKYIPVRVKKVQHRYGKNKSPLIEYYIFDKKKEIGYFRIFNQSYGCDVLYLENEIPEEYKHIGYLADRIEVWNCMQRGLDVFEIRSKAANNSHALHYLRGKRFEGIATQEQIETLKKLYAPVNIRSFKYDNVVKFIIDHTPEGLSYYTKFLDQIPMYMPQNLIHKYVRELLKHPLIIK